MKKLLIITKTVDEGDQLLGFFIGWLREFAKKYYKINVLCLERGNFSLPDNVKVTSLGKDSMRKAHYESAHANVFYRLSVLLDLYKQIWRLRDEYDAVFVHMNAIYVVVGAWLWHLLGKKVFLWYAHKTITWQHRVAEKFAEGIFASTPQGFRLKTHKLHIVGQGIDINKFQISNDKLQKNEKILKILSVGRIAPIKNYESLIGAAEILDRKGLNFSMTIIGAPIFPADIEYEKKIKEIVSSKKLENKIKFVGKISNSDLPAYYQSHQIYVNLSRTGSLDKTIVEAMASGCTVLSSNDSAREFLPPELIIPDNNPVRLADKIIEIKDKNYSEQLREYVIKNHSLENLIDKISSQINTARFNKIVITGHPYAFPYYFKVFEYVENKPPHSFSVSESECGGKSDLVFALPKLWLAKKGKIKIKLGQKPSFQIYGLRAASYGGHGIKGLFKGWLPGLIFLLSYLKIKYGTKVLYSCSEPNLLTTLCNGLMAKLCGMKYIFFTWQNVEPQQYMSGLKLKIYNALARFNLRLADGVICGSKKAAKIISNFQFPISKILISPLSGVDTDKFRQNIESNWREELNIKPEDKLILFYGALDKRKGVDVLIGAFNILNAKRSTLNARIIIVGTGPEQENLKLLTTHYHLQTKVIFLDWLPNDQLPALLNVADVFVYPSVPSGGWEEQFGYAMAEASACGVPVVATKTGSIDEVVLDGRSGLLVEPNNPERLAEAISQILNDPNIAKQIGEYGRKYVVENFSHEVVVKNITNFLYNFV